MFDFLFHDLLLQNLLFQKREFDVTPAGDVALVGIIFPHGYDRAVRFEPDGVFPSRGDGDDIAPAGDVALTGIIISRGDDRAVRFKSDGVVTSR